MRHLPTLLFTIAALLLSASAWPQTASRLPIIDMHLHANRVDMQGPPPQAMCVPNPSIAWDARKSWGEVFVEAFSTCPEPIWSPMTQEELQTRTLAALEEHNVIGVLSADTQDFITEWRAAAPDRIIPAQGDAVGTFNLGAAAIERVRVMKENGEIEVLGEIGPQYMGILPDDPSLDAYWTMAEALDLPVGIHIGTGPPGTPYLIPQLGNYRARLHSPLTMEEVLVRYPKLRVYLMHGGYPMLDDLLAVLYTHPQVYVDVAVIVYTRPRPDFYRFLQAIVDAGYGNRVMFGSDSMIWPETIGHAIRVIEEAPFLSDEQKRDILYNNAARFLRLDEDTIRKHHSL